MTGDSLAGSLDDRFARYLTSNRDFVAPVVQRAVTGLGLPAGARVLDAGTGAGGALVPLADAVGPGGDVLGVDVHPGVVELARSTVAGASASDRIELVVADVLDVLDDAASSAAQGFDAIWASDVVWPGNFAAPPAVVARMAAALRPGGMLALFTSNYYRATFLPGRSRLERAVRAASERRWGLPDDGPHHYDRHLSWLLAAGLAEVSLEALPRIGFPGPDEPVVRRYLESAVLPEMLESINARGPEAGLDVTDTRELTALLTPGDPRYVLDEPGYYVVHPCLLVTGRRAD